MKKLKTKSQELGYSTNFNQDTPRFMVRLKYLSLLIIIIVCCAVAPLAAYAQTIPQNVNVEELSDAQIKQIMQKAQQAGLSDDQLISQAEARGLSANQADALRQRINAVRSSGGGNIKNTGNSTDSLISTTRRLNYQTDSTNTPKKPANIFNEFTPRIFGADLFSNNHITFEPNLRLATPVNYILGPDDEVDISVYGNSLANWKLVISPEGNINIPGVGIINLSGKSVEAATSAIRSKLIASNYAIGRGTNLQVTLGNIRSIKVIINGEVTQPGTYTLPSLATVFTALTAAGGPNQNGSFRKIEIIRNNAIIRTLDVYDFLLKGDQKNNIRLQDQDIIRVPTYRVRVNLAGEVKNPALFEVLPGETLQDVIRFSGGFTDEAYTAKISATQISGQERRIIDVFEDDYKNYIPLRGDKYVVSRILNRFENRVVINGAVFRPGDYELSKGLTLMQLVSKAAGLKEDAFTDRGFIIRLNPDNSTSSLSFSIKAIQNKTQPDIPLQREDVVNIPSKFDLRDQYTVNIQGEVRNPGQFAYADSLTVEDLIIKAGGLAEGASTKRIEVARRVYNSDPKSTDSKVADVFNINVDAGLKSTGTRFVLMPFDIVSVYSLPGFEKQRTVKVEGEVLYPGTYTISKKNEKISDLISRAGGLTASADVEGASLKRANLAVLGSSKSKIDTASVLKERSDRLRRLQQNYKDTTVVETSDASRNDYVGIDMKKILESPGSKSDLILEDKDEIRVPKEQQIVKVNGEVLYPSAVVYTSGKSFNGYVLNAGGYSAKALRRGAYVVYPNGTVKGTRKFLFFNSHPSVKPGSEIFVPLKPEHKGISTQELIGITTGVASLGAIILGIINLSK